MPTVAPSIYQPGTVDLIQLLLQAKNKTSVLHTALAEAADVNSTGSTGGSGVAPSSASEAAGNGTAESVSVGNAVGNVVGNAVMSAVVGPVGMGLASLTGHTPQGLVSQALAAISQAINGKPVGPSSMTAEAMEAAAIASQTDNDPDANGTVGNQTAIDSGGGDPGDAPDTGTADGGISAGNEGDADGGNYMNGGVVPGKSKKVDDMRINVSGGEGVLHRGVVEALGKPFIDFLNNSIPNVMGG